MAATTPVYALPYPGPTDPADVPADIQALANRIELVVQPGTASGQVLIWDSTAKKWVPGPEAWHEIGAAGEPAFAANWSNFAPATDETAGFRKQGADIVRLKGVIKSAAGAIATLFTLPVGYRPRRTVRFLCASSAGGLVDRVEVLNSGIVQSSTVAVPTGYLDLSVMSFAIVP